MARNWICPYCQSHQIILGKNSDLAVHHFDLDENEFGHFGVLIEAIVCANAKCKRVTVHATLGKSTKNTFGQFIVGVGQNSILSARLLPESSGRPQPEFIPQPLRDDYFEACKIRDLSPKASATLARRCLQGMIRDFCGISKARLIDEINELKKQVLAERAPKGVSDDSVEAIDAVRKIGNIGAHMERDIDLIIDVDPGEAQLLIELIETLFEDWYVARHKRAERFSKIVSAAASKDEQKLIAKDPVPKLEPPQEA